LGVVGWVKKAGDLYIMNHVKARGKDPDHSVKKMEETS
jgi:hypothetical protein